MRASPYFFEADFSATEEAQHDVWLRACACDADATRGPPQPSVTSRGGIEKLHALRLRVLAANWLEQDKSPDTLTLPFDDRRSTRVAR